MPETDYYQTMGVAKSASPEEIRKAYKKLAREYHPDLKPDDKVAAEKFKEIQEAYDVLGDADKRAKYDQFGSAYKYAGAGAGGPEFHWSSGGNGPVDLGDIFGGDFDLGDLFAGAGRRTQQTRPRPRRGNDLKTDILVSFETAALGGNHDLQYRVAGEPRHIAAKIPEGLASGQQIRLSGQGEPGASGGGAGDLIVTVNVAPHPWFRREGSHLQLDLPLTPAEAALGTKAEVPTLREGPVVLTVPPGSSSGRKLRLKGKGVKDPKTKQIGDQFVTIKIVFPETLSEEEQKLYEQLAEAASYAPRQGLWI